MILKFLTLSFIFWCSPIHAQELTKDVALVKAPRSDAAMGPEIAIAKGTAGPMRIALALDKTDIEDEALDVTVELWVHNGIFYVWDAAIRYKGGKYTNKDGQPETEPPGFWVNSAEYVGKKIRIQVVPNKTVSVGATTEMTK